MAQRFPRLGGFIAEIELPPGVVLEAFIDGSGHLTLYGDPDSFVHAVVQVVRVG